MLVLLIAPPDQFVLGHRASLRSHQAQLLTGMRPAYRFGRRLRWGHVLRRFSLLRSTIATLRLSATLFNELVDSRTILFGRLTAAVERAIAGDQVWIRAFEPWPEDFPHTGT
jgi:hypothetical protein